MRSICCLHCTQYKWVGDHDHINDATGSLNQHVSMFEHVVQTQLMEEKEKVDMPMLTK